MDGEVDRRLTTVICADVAGYSALMEADEVGTLKRLTDYRARMTKLIQRHRGRIANTAGDAVLAEFPSAFEAVICAIEVQREIGSCNASLQQAERMSFRIGINVGDVLVENGDLFGEGVNVAARLQTLADPGGVLISGSVHDLVRQKLDVGYEFLGAHHLKNMTGDVPIYKIHKAGSNHRKADFVATHSDSRKAAGAHNATDGRRIPELSPAQWIGFACAIASAAVFASFVAPWVFYPLLVAAWLYGSYSLKKRNRNRYRQFAGQCLLFIGFLFGINILSSPFEWWWVHPAAVFGALAAIAYGLSLSRPSTAESDDRAR